MTKLVIFIALFGQVFGADITGQGFLKTKGGDVKTCAGNEVYLEPSNGKWVSSLLLLEEYMRAVNSDEALIYSHKTSEYDDTAIAERIMQNRKKRSKSLEIHYNSSKKAVLTTVCDAQGNFQFNNIKNGKYTIATRVEWKVGDEKQGGMIGDFIDINQKEQKIILSQ